MAWSSKYQPTTLVLITVVVLLGVSGWAKSGTSGDADTAKRLTHCGQSMAIFTLINVTCSEVLFVAKNVTRDGATAVSVATYRTQSPLSGTWQCHASAGGDRLRCAKDKKRFKRIMIDHDPNRKERLEP